MIKLEGYKIIKKLASGGMGDVYLAQHTVLETKVAIKSLHSDLVSDEDFRKRFRTEARTQSRLSHPNIVKLIDFQERKDGLFLIMEYVEGKQLNDYIHDVTGPMPDDKLVPLFKEILSAIKYAHSKGLIHRDIKPSNILITDEGNVKVIDFGIAKSSDEDKGLTKTGVQVGTVSYMSPEQVRAKKLDLLTDIYSLGITLFQMAVGKAPYSAQTNTFEIQLSIVSEPLPNAKDVYPSISDKLVSIIEKATQKKKEERYQSCEEFIKSFDKDEVVEKIKKSKPIKNFEKPLTNSKKSVPKMVHIVLQVFVYIIIGLISLVTIYYFVEEYHINNITIERLAIITIIVIVMTFLIFKIFKSKNSITIK
jgi:serine/threonine protein kinase